MTLQSFRGLPPSLVISAHSLRILATHTRNTRKSDVRKGAAYLVRKTLVLTEEFFRERYNNAIKMTEGKLDIRSYARHEFFEEEQHAECVNLIELREVARDILLRRSTTERRSCPEWLNC